MSKIFRNLTSDYQDSNLNIDPEQRKKLENLLDYYYKYYGVQLLEKLGKKDIQYMLTLDHPQKLKYLFKMHKLEIKKEKRRIDKIRLEEKAKQEMIEREKLQPKHLKYGIERNTMFVQMSHYDMKVLYHHRLSSAILHNQPIIFDLDFDAHMEIENKRSLARQIQFSIFRNQEDNSPFNLTLCNVNFESETMLYLNKIEKNFQKVPINIYTQSYLDLYPKEKLIYLSPNAKEEMRIFDHEAIYIIGGISDPKVQHPLTYAKAKKERIKAQKLPLDR